MRNIFTKCKRQKAKRKIRSNPPFCTLHSALCTNSGYTLLFAMIVASVVLAIGVSILTVSRKEFVLSSSATHSSNSFYAADSGIGCAEYWDSDNGGHEFATDTTPTPAAITCSYADANANPKVTRTVVLTSAQGNYLHEIEPTYTFTFYTPFSTDGTSNKSCAAVTVDKYYVSTDAYIHTIINSSGYNIGYNATPANNGVPDCSSPSPKKVERAIQVTY
jgi:hypothetical protein